MDETISDTNPPADVASSPGLGRRLAVKATIVAGTIGVTLLASDSLALAGRIAEKNKK